MGKERGMEGERISAQGYIHKRACHIYDISQCHLYESHNHHTYTFDLSQQSGHMT